MIQAPEVVKKICKIIAAAGGEARLVGGYIRSYLAGNLKQNADIDMATNLSPEIVMKVAFDNKITAIPTGLKHGTVTLIIDEKTIEITTLRRDIECDGRHAKIEYTNDWKEDAARRDFTINALYADVNGKIYDYFNGINDLKLNVVKFIGEPEKRIHEDYLRIIRYFRFIGYFNKGKIDQGSLDACKKLAYNLEKVSRERIQSELIKILQSHSTSITLMLQSGIFDAIGMSEIKKFNYKNFSNDPIINLATLFIKNDVQNYDEIMKNLRFSNNDRNRMKNLRTDVKVNLVDSPDFFQKNIQLIGKDRYIDRMKLTAILNDKKVDVNIIDVVQNIDVKKIPINGNDIEKFLNTKGEMVGIMLQKAKTIWIENNCEISREEILRLLKT